MNDSPLPELDFDMNVLDALENFDDPNIELDVCGDRVSVRDAINMVWEFMNTDENPYPHDPLELKKRETLMGFVFEGEKLTAHCLEKEHYFGARVHRLGEGCAFCNEERRAAAIEEEHVKKQAYNELKIAELQQQLHKAKEHQNALQKAVEVSMIEAQKAQSGLRDAQNALKAATQNEAIQKLQAEMENLKGLLPTNIIHKRPPLSSESFLDFFDRSTSLESVLGGKKSAFDRVRPIEYAFSRMDEEAAEEYRRDELMMDEMIERQMENQADREIDQGREGRY